MMKNLPSIESEAQRLVLYLVDVANVYGRMEFYGEQLRCVESEVPL